MPSDGAGITDEAIGELYDEDGKLKSRHGAPPPPEPLRRPADSATKDVWADYLIGLGMHPDQREDLQKMTKPELQEKATDLGG